MNSNSARIVAAPPHLPSLPACRLEHLGRVLRVTGLPAAARASLVLRAVAAVERDGRVSARRTAVPAVRRGSSSGREYVPAGLADLAAELAARAGVPVERAGWPERWATGGADFSTFTDAVAARSEVLVRYRPAVVDPVGLVADLCRAFPERRVLVGVTQVRDGHAAAAGLRRRGVDVALARGSGSMADVRSRVWVATERGLRQPQLELNRADFVVLLDAVEGLGQLGRETLDGVTGRLVGFVPADRRLSPFERDILLAYFGSHPLLVVRPGEAACDVRVAFVPIDSPRVPLAVDGDGLRRDGVVRHPTRNRRLARLAARLVGGGDAGLRADFPHVAAVVGGRAVRRAVVLVDALDHAAELARLAPHAAVVAALGADVAGLRPLADRLVPAGANGTEVGLAIATPDALRDLRLGSGDVVIRADGGIGLPPGLTPAVLPARHELSELLVVDADDGHHPELRRRSRRRQLAYADAGWAIGPHDRAGAAGFLLTRWAA